MKVSGQIHGRATFTCVKETTAHIRWDMAAKVKFSSPTGNQKPAQDKLISSMYCVLSYFLNLLWQHLWMQALISS